MDQDSEGSLFWDSGEEVIEVEPAPPRRSNASIPNEAWGSRVIPPDHLPGLADALGSHRTRQETRQASRHQAHRHHHHHRRHLHHHHHHHHRHHPHPAQPPRQRQPTTAVIDLTEESDSPVEVQPSRQPSQPQNQSRGNPRRTNSQRISPPTLSRSDGTISRSNMPDVIDLTVESPEDEIHRQPSLRPPLANRSDHAPPYTPGDSLISVGLVRSARRSLDMRGFSRRLAGILNTDILQLGLGGSSSIPIPTLDVTQNEYVAGPRRTSPKPAMEPTPPTREGFTRDTCAEPTEEVVVICPNCNEELAYDPTRAPAQSSSTGKGGKRKKAAAEHHFWALKKCGHVYCADCFENRRPTKMNRQGVGFPMPDGRDPYSAPNELRCAVQGCDTKVMPKGEWVGLYA